MAVPLVVKHAAFLLVGPHGLATQSVSPPPRCMGKICLGHNQQNTRCYGAPSGGRRMLGTVGKLEVVSGSPGASVV